MLVSKPDPMHLKPRAPNSLTSRRVRPQPVSIEVNLREKSENLELEIHEKHILPSKRYFSMSETDQRQRKEIFLVDIPRLSPSHWSCMYWQVEDMHLRPDCITGPRGTDAMNPGHATFKTGGDPSLP